MYQSMHEHIAAKKTYNGTSYEEVHEAIHKVRTFKKESPNPLNFSLRLHSLLQHRFMLQNW